jgi:hypothetical protein
MYLHANSKRVQKPRILATQSTACCWFPCMGKNGCATYEPKEIARTTVTNFGNPGRKKKKLPAENTAANAATKWYRTSRRKGNFGQTPVTRNEMSRNVMTGKAIEVANRPTATKLIPKLVLSQSCLTRGKWAEFRDSLLANLTGETNSLIRP